MRDFSYHVARTVHDAVSAVTSIPDAEFVAGGTSLVDLMRTGVEAPPVVVDINAVPLDRVSVLRGGGLRIGALARMSDVAEHRSVIQHFPVLSQALLASASPQLRNMASIGGNLLQRTRCPYFRDVGLPCNKRQPGSGCPAVHGNNRTLAVLGASSNCIATHASDMAVAMAALDAVIHLHGPAGRRAVDLVDFYLRPGDTPQVETVLRPGELIVAVDLPGAPHSQNSGYLKVRDRASFEFALTSAAVGLDVRHAVIRSARVALGGVGTTPWRSPQAESVLVGAAANRRTFERAAHAALEEAVTYRHNGFKVALARRTIVRALELLTEGETR